MKMKFEQMGFSAPVLQALVQMGFTEATPIQEQAIPLLMQGEDIIGQAQTGTGKTAAFGLPMIEHILHHRSTPEGQAGKFVPGTARPYGLILTPTRELAVQVAGALQEMGQFAQIHVVCAYGGESIERQIRSFGRPVDILVGTPGRVLDHLSRDTLDLSGVGVAVLDEADRMLDMGFIDDVVEILGRTPSDRQTSLFSATMPREVQNVAYEYMKVPQMIKVSEDKLTVDKIRQTYVLTDARMRLGYLIGALRSLDPKLAVVFVRTKRSADKLSGILRDRGFEVDSLHGDMSQRARDVAMKRFREGHLRILVATDLASRGLDVFDVSHVFNYDLPEEPLTYVHRIGRTGRIGQDGMAVSFVFEDQMQWINELHKVTGFPIEKIDIVPDMSYPPRDSHSRAEGEGGHSGSGRDGAHSRGGYGDRPRSGSHSGYSSHPRGGYGPREGGRGRSTQGPDGPLSRAGRSTVSHQTLRNIRERARKPASQHVGTRGGNYSGRQN